MYTFLWAFLFFAPTASGAAFRIEGVPFVRQDRYQCGPASLASVLAYYGTEVDNSRIIRETYNETLKGSLITDLENFARRMGFKTESGQGTPDAIKNYVRSKRPVIVLLDLGVWVAAKPHYIVVFGYDEKGFIAHDGRNPSVLFEYPRFEKMWQKIGRPYLIIHP